MNQTAQRRNEIRFWQAFAVAAVVVIVVAGFRWSRLHPFGAHWDEAQYLDEVAIDVQRLRAGLLLKAAGRMLIKSWGRPPAYRLLAVPVLAITGFSTTVARLTTLACYVLSSWLVYLSTKRLSNDLGAAFAVLTFCLSAQVVSASLWFSSEGPLYLATSATFYFLFSSWMDDPERSRNWVGLGLAMALGFLSKSSFLLIGGPALALGFVASRWKFVSRPAPWAYVKAGILAACVSGPWWLLNLKAAIAYAAYARGFVRNSLGSPSLPTWGRWLGTASEALLGYAITSIVVLIVVISVREALQRKRTLLSAVQKLGLVACACAGLPIVLMQLSGTNHLLRHISPSLIPLGIAVGIVAGNLDWVHSWSAAVILGGLFLLQLGTLIYPMIFVNRDAVDPGLPNGSLPWRIMSLQDQWDWTPVEKIADQCGLSDPKIAYAGNGRALNQPQIQMPWARKGNPSEVTWLWRYEDGPIDWRKIMDKISQSDLVVTAPGYVGELSDREDLDNHYNSDLASRVSQSGQFRDPVELNLGRFAPVKVLVFKNNRLSCGTNTSR